jgi:hypothetical protein
MVRYVPLHSYEYNERRRRRRRHAAAWQTFGMGALGGLMVAILITAPFLMP